MSSSRLGPIRHRSVAWLGLALAGLLSGAAAVRAEEPAATETAKALFRWKFPEGQSVIWQMDQGMEMSMLVGDMPVTTNMDYSFGMTWKFGGLTPEGNGLVAMTIDGIKMHMKVAGNEIHFDTGNKEAVPEGPLGAAAEIFNALVGLRYDLSMSPRGEIATVDFDEASREKLKKLQANPAMAQFAQMFSADGMRQMIGQTASLFPEEEVPVGHTWEMIQEIKNPILGPQKMTAKMTYEGVEEVDGRPLDKISVDMDTNLGDAKLPGVDKFEMTDQDNKQVMYFDRELGRLVSADSTSHMTMKITVMGQTLEQQIDAKALVTCKNGPAAAETPAPEKSESEPAPTP